MGRICREIFPYSKHNSLKGKTPSEAFFVQCDATVNTPRVVKEGRVELLVGVALIRPAEFEIIRLRWVKEELPRGWKRFGNNKKAISRIRPRSDS